MEWPLTQREVGAHLPDVLAALSVQYVCTKDGNKALSGVYEWCSHCAMFDHSMVSACIGGHVKIVQLMLARGGTASSWAIQQVCKYGHVALAQFLLATQRIDAETMESGFYCACKVGHIGIVRLMLPKLKARQRLVQCGLNNACLGGHLTVVDLIIAHGASDWNTGLTIACKYQHPAIVRRMLEMGATECRHCYKSH
jgi:hypothetical protein